MRPSFSALAALAFGTILVASIPFRAAYAGTPKASHMVTFHSAINAFRIDYPASWTHSTGNLPNPLSAYQYDAFSIGQPSHNFVVNVVVACIPGAASSTEASMLKGNEDQFKSEGYSGVAELGQILVAGHNLTLLRYTDENGHIQAYLVRKGSDWLFGLTTAAGDQSEWLPIFQAMLRSFKLLPATVSGSSKHYANDQDHYALRYPATWLVASEKTASSGDSVLTGIGPTEMVFGALDEHVALIVFVAHHATASAVLKATLAALLHDGTTIVGGVKYGTTAINGVSYLQGSAAIKDSQHRAGEMSVLATSKGPLTYYVVSVIMAPASSEDRANLAAVLGSVTYT